MAKVISPNKLNDRDKRRMENIRDRLRAQNVGEDEATRLALDQIQKKKSGQGGGGHGGGESQKPTQRGGAGRTGSKSGGGK